MPTTFLLIHPSNNCQNQGADIRDDDFYEVGDKSIPLGVISIGSYLKSRGFVVSLLDCRFLTKADIKTKIEELAPNCFAVGLSVMTGQLPHALELSDFIKSRFPALPVIWGGTHPTLYPEQTIADKSIDYVIAGEGELVIEHLLNYIRSNTPLPDPLHGLLIKKTDGSITYSGQHANPIDLEAMPDIDYSLCDVSKLTKVMLLDGKVVHGLGVLTSRGCPYQCTFCPVPNLNTRKWRAIAPDRVLAIIKQLVTTYHLDYIWFMDDFFFGNKARFTAIVNGIIDEKLNIQWSGNIRVDNISDSLVDDTMLQKLKASGCYALHMGMESGDDEVLKLYNKKTTTTQIENAIRKCHQYGIIPNGTWIMGIPGESLSSIKKTLGFIWKMHTIDDTDPVYVPGIYRPHPGGELYQQALKLGYTEPASLRAWNDRELYVGFTSEKYLPWLENASMVRDFRLYGRLITAYKKGLFKKGYLQLFVPIVWLAKIRFATGFWHLRIEAVLFKIAKGIFTKLCPDTYLAKLLNKN